MLIAIHVFWSHKQRWLARIIKQLAPSITSLF